MDDTISTLSPAAFEALVAEALKLCREGTVTGLEASPLAHSALVSDCLPEGAAPAYGARGRALHSVLRWGVTQLRPAGEPIPTAVAWRPYHILHHFYLQGRRVSEVAELLGIVETYFYEVRKQAIAALAAVLREEAHAPRSARERRAFVLEDRYRGLGPTEQTLLRAAAIFRRPVPVGWLLRLVEGAALPEPRAALAALGSAWLLTDEHGSEVLLRLEVRNYVYGLLNEDERATWHNLAAALYLKARQNVLTAAAHWRAAGFYRRAAEALVEHEALVIAESGREALQEALAAFPTPALARLPDDLRAQLELLAGKVAEGLQDLAAAAAEYGAALQAAASPQLKARACLRLAKVLERSGKIDEALAAYQRGLALLRPPEPMLATLYIHRAWIFIQPRRDPARAEADLRQAERLLPPGDLENQADLHNAWAGFYTYVVPDPEQEIAHRLQYWLLARELGDVERELKASLNVGQGYLYQERYADALPYLEQGLGLAVAAGNRETEGQYHKVIGNVYFFQGQYRAALEAGGQAYAIFKEMGNRQWLARTCHDLAEVAAQMEDWPVGSAYWAEGVALTEALDDKAARRDLESLVRAYPRLRAGRPSAAERQQRLLDYLAHHDAITNSEYRALAGVQKAQAARDLKALVAQGLLRAEGRGPATRYVKNM